MSKDIESATLVELIEAHQDSQGVGERPRGSHATWVVRNEVAWAVRDKARALERERNAWRAKYGEASSSMLKLHNKAHGPDNYPCWCPVLWDRHPQHTDDCAELREHLGFWE